LVWVDKIFGGSVPRKLPGNRKGIVEAAQGGVPIIHTR